MSLDLILDALSQTKFRPETEGCSNCFGSWLRGGPLRACQKGGCEEMKMVREIIRGLLTDRITRSPAPWRYLPDNPIRIEDAVGDRVALVDSQDLVAASDAILIARAPQLLSWLKTSVGMLDSIHGNDRVNSRLQIMHDLIDDIDGL